MNQTYNIYCDESCHLENDKKDLMVLGAIWCPFEHVKEFSANIRDIKDNYGLNKNFEIKWTKVSPAKIDFYINIIDYFFDNHELHFRALVALNKDNLRHEDFGQSHDTWYYKMYFIMLKNILYPKSRYSIYIDIKDTHSSLKLKKLHDVLCNNIYDFSRDVIEKVQAVKSHEIEIMQLVDLLIGGLSYENRGLKTSKAKLTIIDHIKERSGYSLHASTLVREEKFNLFFWRPDIREED